MRGYAKWDKFQNVLGKAIVSCECSGNKNLDHFLQVGKMVSIGFGAEWEIKDFGLTRCTIYLIVMNGISSQDDKTLLGGLPTYQG